MQYGLLRLCILFTCFEGEKTTDEDRRGIDFGCHKEEVPENQGRLGIMRIVFKKTPLRRMKGIFKNITSKSSVDRDHQQTNYLVNY